MKTFKNYDDAFFTMQNTNKASKKQEPVCVVPGPKNNFAIVDMSTAITLGLGYVWSTTLGYISNPW